MIINNTTISNEYAQAIIENRGYFDAQLDRDDMTKTLWEEYSKVCDVLVNAVANNDYAMIGTALASMLDFFEAGAKAIDANKVRIITACARIAIKKSDDMKKADKAKRKANAVLTEAKASGDSDAITKAQADFDEAEAEVKRLEAISGNKYYDKVVLLKEGKGSNKGKFYATAKARKNIEDAIADMILEEANKTDEQKAKEKQDLDDQRKGREIRQKEEKKANK